jgi:hypothetical protein
MSTVPSHTLLAPAHLRIDLGDAWGVNVSASRVAASDADVAAAAVAALREASAKLAAPIDIAEAPVVVTTPATTMKPDAPAALTSPVSDDDLMMLAVSYAIILLPVGLVFVPLLQAAAFVFGGPELVKQDYPNWGGGLVAGYGVVAAGVVVAAGLYGFGVFTILSGNADAGSGVLALASVGGAVAVIFLATAAEPAVFYFVAREGRTPVAPKKKPRSNSTRHPTLRRRPPLPQPRSRLPISRSPASKNSPPLNAPPS